MADPITSQRSWLAILYNRLPWVVLAIGLGLFAISLRSDIRAERDGALLVRSAALDRIENAITHEFDHYDSVPPTVFDVEELVSIAMADTSTASFVLTDVGSSDRDDDQENVVFRSREDTTASPHLREFESMGRRWEIALGEGTVTTSSMLSLILRSLPMLIAAGATAMVFSTLSRDTERSERRARELTTEVRQKNEELTRSNEWLESFTKVASHDLRSPLRAVNSLVSFIREDHPDLDESAMYNLTRIEQRVERMNTLIDDLLTLAHVTDGAEKVTHVHFESLVDDVLETVDVPEGFSIITAYAGSPEAELAVTQFKTCVQNLIDNAIKHHNREDGNVVIEVNCGQDEVIVQVTDDGPGIAEQYLDSVFEPFRRLRPDETSPGSGIGLTAILRTVELNGGSIAVESIVDSGTTFTLRWPSGGHSEEHEVRRAAPEAYASAA